MLDRIYLVIILLIIVGGMGYVGYNEIQEGEKKIIQLRENSALLENSVKVSNDTIAQLETNAEQMQEKISTLQTGLKEAEKYQDELNSKLREHNLTKLSAAKPGLIQKRVNNATTEIFRELEEITSNGN